MTNKTKAAIEEAAKLPTMERMDANPDWKLIGHSHQIADTGDYDGHYEITNGKISLLTQDDDDESLQPIVDALNNSGCKFYQNDWFEFENKMLKDENAELKERVKELEATDPAQVVLAEGYHRLQSENEQLREALEHLERFTSDNPDYEFINHRLKETLKQ